MRFGMRWPRFVSCDSYEDFYELFDLISTVIK